MWAISYDSKHAMLNFGAGDFQKNGVWFRNGKIVVMTSCVITI